MTRDEIKALIASGSPSKKAKDNQVTTFVVAFEVNQAPGAKPLLPISIEPNLPLPIGQNKEASTFHFCSHMIHVQHATSGIWAIIYQLQKNSHSWLRASSTRPRNTLLLPYQASSLTRKVASQKMKPTATLPAVIGRPQDNSKNCLRKIRLGQYDRRNADDQAGETIFGSGRRCR
jgi:hypothetical protein